MRTSNKRKRLLNTLIPLLVIIILTPFILIYLLNHGNPYENYLVNKYVPPYLEKMGYTDGDFIEQHESSPNMSSNKDYYHTQYTVRFKDEPDITYYYGVRKKVKKINQFWESYSSKYRGIEKPTLHSEDVCVNYYDNK